MSTILEAPVTREFRERIIEAASRLFIRDGFHATGVDTIVAEAGVAKMTLYKYFNSKESLIVEVLNRSSESWLNWLRERVEAIGETPVEKALAVFDALQEWFAQPDFSGDMFQCAAAEFSAPENPVLLAVQQHQAKLEAFLTELCSAAEYPRPEYAARRMAIIAQGAISTALVTRRPEMAREARKVAEAILAA